MLTKKQLRMHLHHRKEKNYFQTKTEHQNQLPKQQIPLLGRPFERYNYIPNMTTRLLSQHYNDIMPPLIQSIAEQPAQYNEKDNRTLLNTLDYHQISENKDYHLYCGIVIGQRVNIDKYNNVRLYLLIDNVAALINQPGGHYTFRRCTDHLWIDVSKCSGDFVTNRRTNHITIGIGDVINFVGKIHSYRGYRENIRQTKYGITNVEIINSGYPRLKFDGPDTNNHVSLNLLNPVNYQHHHHYLIQWHNPDIYFNPMPSYGDQIDDQIKQTINDPNYNYGDNPKVSSTRELFKQGLHYHDSHTLIYNYTSDTYGWKLTNDIKSDDHIVGSTEEMHAIGFEKFYQQTVKRQYWRYLKPIKIHQLATEKEGSNYVNPAKYLKRHTKHRRHR